MYRYFYLLFIAALSVFGEAAAQQMPERSAVRSGNRQFHKGNYEKSIERYQKALTHAPGQFEATYDLGNALYEVERYDQAEQTLRQAAADTLRTDAERAEAFYNLGNAQFRQQKYKEALESYKQSLRFNPSDMEAKYNYAYTKKLLDNDQNGGGGQDQEQQDQQNDRNQQDNQNGQNDRNEGEKNPSDDPQQGDEDEQQGDRNDPQDNADEQNGDDRQGQPQAVPAGISEQEQQQMLDAIQAQEDRTQEKLKEKQGVVVRGTKNW
ncbi:MAG: tetratricopeptide repeat protein [Alistipes senegalensis]|nr:tetratricopeptide repeat protein [Bacteroides cellulosilyticus]MCM1352108.1 tetratricopeptide repeat protein [Alistipes senegalensis]